MNCFSNLDCIFPSAQNRFSTDLAQYEYFGGELKRNNDWITFCQNQGYDGLAMIQTEEELMKVR